MMKASANFYSHKKREMVIKCNNMGIDQNQTNAFLDMIGIPDPDSSWITTYKDDPNFRNGMKF